MSLLCLDCICVGVLSWLGGVHAPCTSSKYSRAERMCLCENMLQMYYDIGARAVGSYSVLGSSSKRRTHRTQRNITQERQTQTHRERERERGREGGREREQSDLNKKKNYER